MEADVHYVSVGPFSYRKGEKTFEERMGQLNSILEHKKNNNAIVDAQYYGKVIKKSIKAELTPEQERTVCALFKEKGLVEDGALIITSRTIRQYVPNREDAEEKLDHALSLIQKHKIWNRISPELKNEMVVNKYLAIDFEEMVALNDPEKLKGWCSFKNRETILKNIEKLEQIIVHRSANKPLPDNYYEDLLEEIIYADLTKDEVELIWNHFNTHQLAKDGYYVCASRKIRLYAPHNHDKKWGLNQALEWIKSEELWGRVQPKLLTLSPTYHVEIAEKYNDSLKPFKERFEDMLRGLQDWNTQEAIKALKSFKEKNHKLNEYFTVDWDTVYALIRSKFSILSKEERSELISVYLSSFVGKNRNNFQEILLYILGRLANPHMNTHSQGDEVYDLFDLKGKFAEFKLNELQPVEIQHIAELCAYLVFSEKDEESTCELFPIETYRDAYLLERFKVYCQNIKDSKVWNLDRFKKFFDVICYKFYKQRMEGKTFFSIVECSYQQLTKEQRKEIKTAGYFKNYVELDYRCCFTMAQCNHLARLKIEDEVQNLFKEIEKNLKFLAEKYATSTYTTRYLSPEQWTAVFEHIKSLNLPENLYKPILEIFRRRKDPNSWIGAAVSKSKKLLYGVKSSQMAPVWKGEKYDTFINAVLEWIKNNEKFILENNKESRNSTNTMIDKVNKLIDYFKKLDPLLNDSKEEILKYNETRRDAHVEWKKMLREAINDREFTAAFKNYWTAGKVSGSMLILKELCEFTFTGINVAPFIVNLMRELIPFGFDELANVNQEVAFLAEKELLQFTDPLEIDFDLQREAIQGLPEKFKTPYFHLIGHQFQSALNADWDPLLKGNLPYPFLSINYNTLEGDAKKVTFIRTATPTGPNGINPEFSVFIRNKCNNTEDVSLFISLQSSTDTTESKRIKEQMNHNRTHNFFAAFPVTGDFYMQEGAYENDSRYPVFTEFASDLTKQFIAHVKGQIEVNKPGNYLLSDSWLLSPDFTRDLQKCITDVKGIFFKHTEALTAAQRRTFIKFFNIRFAFYLISFTGATKFGFFCNHSADRTGVFYALLLKMLTVRFNNKDTVVFGEGKKACTYEQMWRGLVHGAPLVTVKRPMNHRRDELTEALEILEDTKVQKRLASMKDFFGIEEMSYPFSIKDPEDY